MAGWCANHGASWEALGEDTARVLGDQALEGRPVGRRLSWLFPVRDQTRGPVARRLVTM
jgi:hypothetical protein